MVPGALPPLAKPSVVRTVESDEEDDGGDDKSGVERFLGGAVDLSKDVVSAGADGAKWTGGQISQVPGGFKEGVEGLAEGGATVYRLSSINRRINPDSHKREQEKLRQAAQYAWDDPVGFGKAAVNYEDLADGRYGEWLGGLGPDALAAAATAGIGVAVTRGTRAVDTLGDASEAARDAGRASDAAGAGRGSGAADAGPRSGSAPEGDRPSWRQSETDTYDEYRGRGYEEQRSFKDGEEVPYGTKGSSRPELYKEGSSIEVKNYDVETSRGRSNLVRNIGSQTALRGVNLPKGTTQRVLIDVRGQNASPEMLDALAERVAKRSGGHVTPENVVFRR